MSLRDMAELIALGGLWGASFLFMRVAVPEFGPFALIEIRVAIAALFLTLVLAVRGELSGLRGHTRQFLILGALNSAIPFTLFAYATLTLPAGFSGVLNATVPLFGAVVAYLWFRERLPVSRMVGLMVGFCGVMILVWGKLTLRVDLQAVGAGLVAAMCYAIAAHYSRRNLLSVPPLAVSAGGLIAASLWLLPVLIVYSAMVPWPERLPGRTSWLSAVALGIACTGIAYALYFRLIRNLGASRTITVTYLIPAFAMLWGCLFLGEAVTATTLVGAGVVLVGTLLVNRS